MALVLGIDTSNYTTSAAVFNTDTNTVEQAKKLLPVKKGDCGIRQSDAVFHHTKQLPEIISSLNFNGRRIDAVAVSSTPRECEGSYMPCFLAGVSVATSISAVNNIPLYTFSHQQGHIAAAAFGSSHPELLKAPFIAFHVSGGTTEALLVTPSEESFVKARLIAETADLNAGQRVDRIGVLLDLQFPCGIELEKLANTYSGSIKVKPSLKGSNCNLSGFQNKITKLYEETGDKAYVSAYTLKVISETLIAMTKSIIEKYGELPLLFAGGVMSNQLIKNDILNHFNAYFAPPQFSADNASGVAYLGAKKFLTKG
ncbi:MAG: peptidase M22 [Clostridia bacterium]|nr:peptidase M22 [Clostridia bacterium]